MRVAIFWIVAAAVVAVVVGVTAFSASAAEQQEAPVMITDPVLEVPVELPPGTDVTDAVQTLTDKVDPLGREGLISAVLYLAAGLFGMFVNALRRWATGQIEGNLWDYFFIDHGRRSVAAVMTFVGSAATVILSGQLIGLSIPQILLMSFPVGYAVDSAINKGALKT